ncbi:hypothetical protein MKZ38_009123 [Zalerion maritima]|uniref:Uncharacterized protein n=1 Tax=Zalerion maritima TaxID=339359 RepID=A0AAD5RHF0_9PEZI|nr:hypothetical protein MKZ38_009123 [Zalerion maritima]
MECPHDIPNKSSPASPPPLNKPPSSPASNRSVRPRAGIVSPLATSVPILRFPRPYGSEALASWISQSDPNIMSTDGSMSLTDSAYEVIYTDGESQDGHGTESICSLESPRTDDVRSIAGTDQVYDDDHAGHEDEHEDDDDDDVEEHQLSGPEHTSNSSRRSSSLEYADHALRTPSPHSGHASLQSLQSVPSLGLSIEFNEKDHTRCQGNTSVKHTIRTFSEDESSQISHSLGIEGNLKPLVAAIRQTMSDDYLCTQGPLRILYVGSQAAQHDIIYKISSALTASTSTESSVGTVSSRGTDRIYNIVPVSAFGSTNIPEVELMETSAFQIKVENCTAAEELIAKDSNCPVHLTSPSYNLIINDEKTVMLSQIPGAKVKTNWELPHIAVFYCTDNDDLDKTRDAAWGAMTSRDVPCLFITHDLDFEKPPTGRWRGYLDPDILHISLESGDPGQTVVPERLPVDLTSFLTIDARQMNRNLAQITGLRGGKIDLGKAMGNKRRHPSCKNAPSLMNQLWFDLVARRKDWPSTVIQSLLVSLFLVVTYISLSYLQLGLNQTATPMSMNTSSVLSSSTPIQTATATVTVELTSTRTVEVPRLDMSSAPWFFDNVIWPMPGKPVFTASKGVNAVLLKIDTDYSHWVIPGRLRVTVHRGPEPVLAQITVHDGRAVLVEVGRHDAHGVLTVQVETTQKPKVNEKYEIDFGKPRLFDMPFSYVHNFALNLAAAANETVRGVPQGCGSGIHALSEAMRDQASSRSSSLMNHLKEAGEFATSLALRVRKDAEGVLVEAQEKLAARIPSITETRQKADFALRKAQISSKLWWLKAQGKRQEYEKYETKAVQFLEDKIQHMSRSPKGRQTRERSGIFSYLTGDW